MIAWLHACVLAVDVVGWSCVILWTGLWNLFGFFMGRNEQYFRREMLKLDVAEAQADTGLALARLDFERAKRELRDVELKRMTRLAADAVLTADRWQKQATEWSRLYQLERSRKAGRTNVN